MSGDSSLSEKRVYGDRRDRTRAYVASDAGVAFVDVSDDQVGRFGLAEQCVARDVAGAAGRVLVATEGDVLVGEDEAFVGSGFGPADRVGVGPEALAAREGEVAWLDGDEWRPIGSCPPVRALAGVADRPGHGAAGPRPSEVASGTLLGVVGTAEGVFDVVRDGEGVDLSPAGLEAVRDVAPGFAATPSGVYRRNGDWERAVAGDATVVASDGERAHAVVEGALLERRGGDWVEAGPAGGTVVDVAYGAGTVAVTGEGRVCLDPARTKDGATGWRDRSIGLGGVVGVAVP